MALAAPQTTFAPRQIVADSLAHLVRLVRPDGRFVYAHPAGHPDMPLDGYNMLRHCGTLWFMLRAVNDMGLDPGDNRLRTTLFMMIDQVLLQRLIAPARKCRLLENRRIAEFGLECPQQR